MGAFSKIWLQWRGQSEWPLPNPGCLSSDDFQLVGQLKNKFLENSRKAITFFLQNKALKKYPPRNSM